MTRVPAGTPAPVPDVPAPRPVMRVHGGAGGTRAHLEDLTRAAGVLRDVAEHLDAARRATAALDDIVEEGARWSPATTAAASHACQALTAPLGGLGSAALAARTTADSLDRAAQAYAEADTRVTRVLRAGLVATANLVGEAGPVAWLAAGALGAAGGSRLLAVRLLMRTPTPVGLAHRALAAIAMRGDGPVAVAARHLLGGRAVLPDWPETRYLEPLVDPVAAWMVGAMPGRSDLVSLVRDRDRGSMPTSQAATGLLGVMVLAALATGHRRGELVVAPSLRAEARPGAAETPPRDVADVVARIPDLYADHERPGELGDVAVTRVEQPDGSLSWVVTVPGTSSWSPFESTDPFDVRACLQEMATDPAAVERFAAMQAARDDVTATVVRAMDQAGIRPGEPVVIAGHSLGGIAAMDLAADPTLGRFDIRAVITVGSPVAAHDVPSRVQTLHLETSHDAVPTLDGRPNPDAPNRTTVTVDLEAGHAFGDAADTPSGAHAVGVYADAARMLRSVDHPSVVEFERHLGEVVGGPGTTASTTRYTGMRLPPG